MLYYFLSNLAVLVCVLFVWSIAGLGLALLFAPSNKKGLGFLLAPLIGTVLVASLALFRIGILVAPPHPWADLSILSTVTLLIVFGVARTTSREAFNQVFREKLKWAFLVPLLYCGMMAYLFHTEGFHTISGSQDEIQYSLSADFIYSHLHRGDALDHPGPRGDHWILDFTTMEQPYNKTQRLGAELLLGSVFSEFGILPEKAFPITTICVVASFLMVVAYLAIGSFGINLVGAMLMQTVFGLSFHFILFHFQGSLAYLCSLGMFFVAICSVARGMSKANLKLCALGGLMIAGTFIYYADAAVGVLLVPMLFSVGLGLKEMGLPIEKKRLERFVFCAMLTIGVASLFSHQALFTAQQNFIGNVQVMLTGILSGQPSIGVRELLHRVAPSNWQNYGPIAGLYSYYSDSAKNVIAACFFSRSPIFIVLTFILIGSLGIFGFLKKTRPESLTMALTLSFLCSLVLLSLKNQDVLRFTRSSSYSYPYALFGLMLAVLPGSSSRFNEWIPKVIGRSISCVSAIVLVTLVILNFDSVSRTVRFITSHTVKNDPILRRFDPSTPDWVALREELSPSAQTPILFSGFKNTVYPNLIASGIRPFPHFLGSSISSFWRILTESNDAMCYDVCDRRYTSRLGNKEMRKFLTPPNWKTVIPDFVNRSEQAIIPVGDPFPVEWEAWKDIFSPRRYTFINMCDVVYKHEFSIRFGAGIFGERKKDSFGYYRVLLRSGNIYPDHSSGDCFKLRVIADRPDSVEFRADGRKILAENRALAEGFETTATFPFSELFKLELGAKEPGTKVRWVEGIPSTCSSSNKIQ